MIVALTGTPGTGKTAVANFLQKKGIKIVDLNKVVVEQDFLAGFDKKRESKIVDIDRLNKFVKDNYMGEEDIFLVGHISHLLKNVGKIIVLRCHPNQLKTRLSKKGWAAEKIKENIEAEILDIILSEAVEAHTDKNVFEIDTTNLYINEVAAKILEIIENKFKYIDKFKVGNIDWSEEVFNWI